jgi:hypothetical protein
VSVGVAEGVAVTSGVEDGEGDGVGVTVGVVVAVGKGVIVGSGVASWIAKLHPANAITRNTNKEIQYILNRFNITILHPSNII